MRLRRLDLTRFGHFTNFSLDFGVCESGKSDMHIIYGPNEAGKSTAFEAYLALLFGIPARSQYNFLHDYDNMRIGACVEIDGAVHELVRVKKRLNDLLDADGNPVNPTILPRALGGMNRAQYQAMFSLDDETIEKGGDDILASNGDLGQLLFSAAAGLSDLSGVLDKARLAAEAFHKTRAKKTFLAEARRELKVIEAEIREIDLNATRFRALRLELETAAKTEREAQQKCDELRQSIAHQEAVIDGLPLLAECNGLQADLETVKDYSAFQKAWIDQARNLREQEIAATTAKASAQELVDKLVEQLGAIKPDIAVIAVKNEITQVMDAPRSRALTARDDLPKRKLELTELNADIGQAVKNLNLSHADLAQLSAPVLERFERLTTDVETARDALKTAQNELQTTQDELDEVYNGTPDAGEVILSVEALRALLDRLAPETLSSQQRETDALLRRELKTAADAVANLVPWHGEPAQLPTSPITEDHAKRIAEEWAKLQEKQKAAQQECDKVALELVGVQARIDAIKTGGSVFTDEDRTTARKARDAAWDRHATALSRETAETFHQQLVQVDTVQDTQLEAADRLAGLRELQLSAAELTAQKTHWKRQTDAHAQALQVKQGKFNALLSELTLPESFEPRDLPNWLKLLAVAKAALATLSMVKVDQARVQVSISAAKKALRTALSATTEESDLLDLVRLARQTLENAGRAQERARSVETARTKLAKRKHNTDILGQRLVETRDAWRKLAENSPLKFDGPSDFRDALPTLRKLGPWLSEREKLNQRIDAMKKDTECFAVAVSNLNTLLGVDQTDESFSCAKQLQDRLITAEKTGHYQQTLITQLHEQRDALARIEFETQSITEMVETLAQSFPEGSEIKTAQQLIYAVENAQKSNDLRENITKLQQMIALKLGQGSFEAALSILADKNLPVASARLQGAKDELSEAQNTLGRTIGDLRAASDALEAVGGDEAVARLQEKRQVLLLDIAEQAKKSLRLRLGILLAEQALTRYRETHRSGMLADTEKALSMLTVGRYARLETQPDGKRELLLAFRDEDNRSISAGQMSKGTRFQLYLALRLAGYGQFIADGTSLPFIADDILETFDNTRTSAALDLLGEISLNGQSLYFTHHEHVVDLARERLGERCHIHDLSAKT